MTNIGVLTRIMGSACTQFGKKVLATQLRYATLEAIFEVDEEVQRKLDPKRRVEIREFIIQSLEGGKDFYFSPFVFSARGAIKETADGWELTPGSKLYIIDGQHRSASISSAISHLKSRKESAEETGLLDEAVMLQSYIEKLKEYPVAMQVFLDLTASEERQLFTDINTERREAHIGQIMLYDQRDQYTELTRNVASQLQHIFEIEQSLSRISIHNSALTSLATMKKCIIALFEGILTVKKGPPYYRCNPKEAEEIAIEFFRLWKQIFPKKSANRIKFVSGYSGIQIALAYCANQLTRMHNLSYIEAIQELKNLKYECSWKHNDPVFRHLFDSGASKIKGHSSTRKIQQTSLEFKKKIEQGGLLRDRS
ncbi:DNA sulfur modification protein DndB [Cytobacillus oceanisediminis]|uniref:DNA sulfur modification protein DndB n=1 Tax=Cytobacillus oceanisediminis TaxID=665099 RepID=UPI001FB1B46A|nr:DNA sulfur modification protein DndB [Cytobacillus oceanisediminis]UOE53554.1 DGQHR domain-containing protein [Cytobacillus oceanisediminis]